MEQGLPKLCHPANTDGWLSDHSVHPMIHTIKWRPEDKTCESTSRKATTFWKVVGVES